MTTVEKWKKYWQEQKTPLHRYDTIEHYQSYAAELRINFKNTTPKSVLEIGCGNGALYNYLGFDQAQQYKGVDFSPSMLATFKQKHQDVELECCDGSSYSDENKYDLIFSNGVIQNFDRAMLRQHFAKVKTMMHEKSYFVCASIPWKVQKFRYITGELGARKNPFLRVCISYLKSGFKDSMGTWYDFRDISKLSTIHGMSVNFYGSMHYLYRFHAVMKIK